MCILKILTDLCLIKLKTKIRNIFVRTVYSVEEALLEHKEDCLIINGKQNVKLKKDFITFEIYFKQIPVPFKIDSDIECSSNSSYTRKYKEHVPCSFAYKVVCVDNKFSKKMVLYRGKDAINKFIKSILNEYNYCRKVMRKHFNKNLIMSVEEEEEERFEQSNICGICSKLFDISDEKVRDHCHISGKCKGAAHWSCNINFKITKKFPVIFHNLKAHDSHLIFKELDKFNSLF